MQDDVLKQPFMSYTAPAQIFTDAFFAPSGKLLVPSFSVPSAISVPPV